MANELSYRHAATGETLYATIRSVSRQMWNTDTPGFESLTVANWGDYVVALTETPADSYFYVGNWPAGLIAEGNYWVDVYEQAGEDPAIGDELLVRLFGYWDGAAFRLASDGDLFDATGFDVDDLVDALAAAVETGLTDDQWTALRTILGVPDTGTTPEEPTAGAIYDMALGFEEGELTLEDLSDTLAAAVLAVIGSGWSDIVEESYPALGESPTAGQMIWMVFAGMLQRELDGSMLKILDSDGATQCTFRVTRNASNFPVKLTRIS